MYRYSVPKEHEGKSLKDIVLIIGREEGVEWGSCNYLASLDGRVVALNFMTKTLVSEGQIVKVFQLPSGG